MNIIPANRAKTLGAPYRCSGCFRYTKECTGETSICHRQWAVSRLYPYPIVWPAPSLRTRTYDLLYVFRDVPSCMVKIGHSINPYLRMRCFQPYHGAWLEMAMMMSGGRKAEREAHRRFREYRQLNEWFLETPDISSWIQQHRHVRDTEQAVAA